jgi:DnaK suppressor protein
MLKTLTQALERMRQGSFGECAECGSDIELKRLEAIPWARYASDVRNRARGLIGLHQPQTSAV